MPKLSTSEPRYVKPRGKLNKVIYGKAPPQSSTPLNFSLTLLFTIFDIKRTPFIYSLRGGSRIFFRGGALVSCSTSTPINHIVFFLQNISCIRKPQVISGGGGGGCAPTTPSPRSALESIDKWHPFHIPCLELFICKCTVF